MNKSQRLSCFVVFFLAFTTSCNESYKSMEDIRREQEQRKNEASQYQLTLAGITQFDTWWDYSLGKGPIHTKYSHISNLTKQEVDAIYSWYIKELMNSVSGGSDRFYSAEKEMAERLSVHYLVFKEVAAFMGLDFFPYLEKVTKEFFSTHMKSIVPDYYSPIQFTALPGDYTFAGTFELRICRDSKELDIHIQNHIDYLKRSLPKSVSGFKIFDVRYNCEKTGTEGSFDVGYVWKRKGNVLLKMKSGSGLYGGHRTPEENELWHERSWNNKKVLQNSPDTITTIFKTL